MAHLQKPHGSGNVTVRRRDKEAKRRRGEEAKRRRGEEAKKQRGEEAKRRNSEEAIYTQNRCMYTQKSHSNELWIHSKEP